MQMQQEIDQGREPSAVAQEIYTPPNFPIPDTPISSLPPGQLENLIRQQNGPVTPEQVEQLNQMLPPNGSQECTLM